MAKSLEERNHQEWLGYVQPVGLVVSVPAMLAAQCHVNLNVNEIHRRFLATLPTDRNEIVPRINDLRRFVTDVLEWRDEDLVKVPVELDEEFEGLEVVLPEYHERLRPDFVVPTFRPDDDENRWMILVKEVAGGRSLDEIESTDKTRWQASPHAKLERLLRETQIPIGLLTNGDQIRLIYAPRGETSGYMTFDVAQMAAVAGRPIFAALHMLLSEERLFSLEKKQRLPAILADSRRYQNTVSTKLAQQVMAALFELLRGFQAADDQRGGDLLRDVLRNNPQHVYHGLLTVLMRMVFVLYAEDRGVLSTEQVYTNYYSVSGLFQRLRADAGRFPDTMDQRFGAWAQLITLFRLIFEGGQHREFRIPPRSGYLFDPDRYPFLEGRFDDGDIDVTSEEELASEVQVPRVSDGVVYRVLENLLVLDGERLSYRTLDVEQIGSVYEAIMGFELQVAAGRSIAIKPAKSHGAPATINLEALLEAKPADRAKRLKEWTDQKLTGEALKELKSAESIEDMLAALDKKVAKSVTPNIVPRGAMVFQPSDERRRSGSHYTPRSLTEPIVRTTLEPILKQLCDPNGGELTVWEPQSRDRKRYTKGEIARRIRISENQIRNAKSAREIGVPHPSQILDLKICDPAMGSGAFLVEACRQLGDELIRAWYAHDMVPSDIPADEDEVLYARRLVAQRCLYGVDKNVMAVDLAKLSLWLVTLARDHAFTFLDHSLRHGDSLVGLTREQIIGFHWDRKKFKTLLNEPLQKRLDRATEARAKILNAREDVPYKDQEQRLSVADEALDLIRVLGDACVSCFFAESKKKAREEEADRVYGLASSYLESQKQPQVDHASRTGLQEAAKRLRDSSQEHPVPAFHWEIEFPEVFSRENGGFDAFVGNPPFLGGRRTSSTLGSEFSDWLTERFKEASNNSDLVGFFFRQAFDLLRSSGSLGLIATNTIGQGDTRATALRWICENGGTIYDVRKRIKWPGVAAVVVSVLHIAKSQLTPPFSLDGENVQRITAFLVRAGANNDPVKLKSNDGNAFQGMIVLGMGFTFDDKDKGGTASSISLMHELLAKDVRNEQRIFPYLGGDEILNTPEHSHHRFVIDFNDMPIEEASKWPDLLEIVERKVKPDRDKQKRKPLRERWWQYADKRPALREAIAELDEVLVHPFVSKHLSFTFVPSEVIVAGPANVFASESRALFACLQSRVHETWARFFGSALEDRPRYTTTDCYETFATPKDIDLLTDVGTGYLEFRTKLMVDSDEGMTETYNRFHSPEEVDEGILELRRLHGLMDGAVLRAYGWDDLAESAAKSGFCEFLLDYEEEEDDDSLTTKKKSKKKKPWRYRWPDDFRDEVLARLLELNEQRHKEELLAGTTAEAALKNEGTNSAAERGRNQADIRPNQAKLF